MSSDISRQRFDPRNNFSGVLMQQGRVQLDAEWNEWNEISDRRLRSETIDIIGRGVVPRETPDGFAIQWTSSALTIGRGRIYVDGLQAENHGAGDLEFDTILAESRGVDPLPYEKQPYLPGAPVLPESGGPHLVYLDVWEREVTAVENPALREVALGGPDTTTRMQTVWQVRVLAGVGGGTTCATPDGEVKGWLELTSASAGRLTTRAVGVATEKDPCLIPPSGGYRGLDNRTYRLEIHDGGAVGMATFKWSRDNASLATGVSAIENDKTLTVERTLWDSERRFKIGDWVEITDDVRELSGAPGELRRIADDVDDGTRRITLSAALPTGAFPVNAQNLTASERHTRIKRWDQSGIVRATDGTTYVDLDAAGGSGLIDVPPSGTSLILENGVEVTFATATNGGTFRSGDFWIFAARTADASVEELTAAPPRGVHHHYCRLAVVTLPNDASDCRVFWPPQFGGGESCDCTVCVGADEHNQGSFTIYEAVAQIAKTGGTICLGPGIFNLQQKPVELQSAFAVRIRGQGAATVLIQPRGDAAFILSDAQWCTLDYLTVHTVAGTTSAPAIRLQNSLGTMIERLIIGPPTTDGDGPLAGVLLEPGFLLMTKIRDNFIWAQQGVSSSEITKQDSGDESKEPLLLNNFLCEKNDLRCSETGVQLGDQTFCLNHCSIAGNTIYDTEAAGVSVTGFAIPRVDLVRNFLTVAAGDGIVAGIGGVDICDNQITGLAEQTGSGIRLAGGTNPVALLPVVISGNGILGLRGNGIVLEKQAGSVQVDRNVIHGVGGSGVVMSDGSAANSLSVRSNEFVNIATDESGKVFEFAAIYLQNVLTGAVSDNTISLVGQNLPRAQVIAGIRLEGCLDVRVNDNTISGIAPAAAFDNLAAGVLAMAPLTELEIADNSVRRQLVPPDKPEGDVSQWQAIRIIGAEAEGMVPLRFANFEKLTPNEQIATMGPFAAAGSVGSERIGIVGNALHGYGGAAVVEASLNGSCRFSDNETSLAGVKAPVAVDLSAETIIAAENRVTFDRERASLDLHLPDKPIYTALGNITTGPIRVNGASFAGTQWEKLNVIAP